MNVEIGAEAALFPEKEYIKGNSLQCRADKLWATHKQQSHDLVANMDIAGRRLRLQLSRRRSLGQKNMFAWKKSRGIWFRIWIWWPYSF
jgi:hypothetical protein